MSTLNQAALKRSSDSCGKAEGVDWDTEFGTRLCGAATGLRYGERAASFRDSVDRFGSSEEPGEDATSCRSLKRLWVEDTPLLARDLGVSERESSKGLSEEERRESIVCEGDKRNMELLGDGTDRWHIRVQGWFSFFFIRAR